MILHRIIGLRQSGKTFAALNVLRYVTSGQDSLYVARNHDDALRCARLLSSSFVAKRIRSNECEWIGTTRRNCQGLAIKRHCRFVGEHSNTVGHRFSNVVFDCRFADLHKSFLNDLISRVQNCVIVVSADPWQRDMRHWLRFVTTFRDWTIGTYKEILTMCLESRKITTIVVKNAESVPKTQLFAKRIPSIWYPDSPFIGAPATTPRQKTIGQVIRGLNRQMSKISVADRMNRKD